MRFGALTGQDDPVAFFEIGNALRKRPDGQGVGANEHFAVLTPADDQRRTAAGAKDGFLFAADQNGQGVGAMQAIEHAFERILQLGAGLHRTVEQMGDDLGVGIGLELLTLGLQLRLEFGKVFNDAVVDDRHLAEAMWVGVANAGGAVRRPAGMADADDTWQRLFVDDGFEVANLAGRATTLWTFGCLDGDTGRIVAAIFEPTQRFKQARGDVRIADDTNNAAHEVLSV